MRDFFHQPLFNSKLIAQHFAPRELPQEHSALIAEWTVQLKGDLRKAKEVSVRPSFLQRFFVQILGYTEMGAASWTLHSEQKAASGSVDAALGFFGSQAQAANRVVAPFELKGPATRNLDALMPGRYKSPVGQAWEYANDLPGSQFVLVSNCDEIRLYALGWGRQHYEQWFIADLQDPAHYARFIGLLHSDALLTGKTKALLAQNAQVEKDITDKLYRDYRDLRAAMIVELHHLNPHLVFDEILQLAQKLIDRLLFIAFSEDRGLLPAKSIEQAAQHIDPYNPQPRWRNFLTLFAAVDRGNPYLKIPPYNGGLFAPDAVLDSLRVSDALCERFTVLGAYDFASEVSVTVLGHIFEQSIADLEELQKAGNTEGFELDNSADPIKGALFKGSIKRSNVDGKRKREGVVYTPDAVTRFMTERTLRPVINERFRQTLLRYVEANAVPLSDSRSTLESLPWRSPTASELDWVRTHAPSVLQTKAHNDTVPYLFWTRWLEELKTIRVCDPACGSGAFLVAAFDVLKEAYTQVNLRITELAPQELFNPQANQDILNSNLYGVDINAESIEITKLSLWLKTAEYGKPLLSLEAHLHQGNSLVHDNSAAPHAFSWQERFAEVFAADSEQGIGAGFDVVLGNPPYVRQEVFSALKPYLQGHYQTYHGMADLYVYFYELALKVLKPKGRLGFISNNRFFTANYGKPLRHTLSTQSHLEVLLDLEGWQVFEGVTTYPVVVIGQKAEPEGAEKEALSEEQLEEQSEAQLEKQLQERAQRPIAYLRLQGAVADLGAHFDEHHQTLLPSQLGSAGLGLQSDAQWQLEGEGSAALRKKLCAGHATFKEVCGPPLYGIKTGLNEAFVIDRAQRDRLVLADIACEALIKPFIEGKDIKRWRLEPQERWLILIPKGWTRAQMTEMAETPDEEAAWTWLSERHAPLAQWLAPFAEKAQKRSDKGDYWWELRACGYYEDFSKPKIFYPDICVEPTFVLDEKGFYSNNTGYFLPLNQPHLLAVLNSNVIWFLLQGLSTGIRGGFLRMFSQFMLTLPIPDVRDAQKEELGVLAQSAAQVAAARLEVQAGFRRRLYDLSPLGAQASLGEKLKTWWELADFQSLHLEVKKRFKQEIPLKACGEWEDYFKENQTRIAQRSAELAALERSINQAVYALYGLDKNEIALIEAAVKRS